MMSEHTHKMFADSVSANDNARTLEEVEADLALVRAELEPLERAEAALLKRAIELREMGDDD